eukprot:UN13444
MLSNYRPYYRTQRPRVLNTPNWDQTVTNLFDRDVDSNMLLTPFNSGVLDWLSDFDQDTFTDLVDLLPSNNIRRGRTGYTTWPMDICETDSALIFHADASGIPKENISVTIENGYLKIEGKRKSMKETTDSDTELHRIERRSGSFYRQFKLPRDLDSNARYTAKVENGELTVTLPKQTKAGRPESGDVLRIDVQ